MVSSDTARTMRREIFHVEVAREVVRAYEKHGVEPWSRHEFYAILKEEFDELWDEIKKDGPSDELMRELVQVAAVCSRYAETSVWGSV